METDKSVKRSLSDEIVDVLQLENPCQDILTAEENRLVPLSSLFLYPAAQESSLLWGPIESEEVCQT